MKRRLIGIAVLAGLAALVSGTARALEPAGNVVAVRGKAVVERTGRAKALRARAELLETDSVRTRQRSRLKMLFRNDSILTLGSNSRLIIRQYLHDAKGNRSDSVFELVDGKMRAIVGSGAFKVLTPTAYAAARGTIFFLWFDSTANTTGIAVIEGGLEIRNIRHAAERGIILTAGQMSLIAGNDGPSPPEPFSLDLWSSAAEGSHWRDILQELADLGEEGNEESIEPVGDIPPPGGGDPGFPGGPDPPVIEPPIDLQPPEPPATAPIAVEPIFP